MYVSKYYKSGEEIDERLIQGYYDDALDKGFEGTLEEFWKFILSIADKVDKEEGKGLSTNDFTDELLKKLNDIADGATAITKVSQLENDAHYQTDEDVKVTIAELINGAPDALDTLYEIAKALNDDPDFATHIIDGLTALREKIQAEATRATEAETELSEAISTLEAKITETINNLTTDLETKINQVQDNVDTVDKKVDELETELANDKTDLEKQIAAAQAYAHDLYDQEKDRATGVESTLKDSINELSTKEATDIATIQVDITNARTYAKEQADEVQKNLTQEITDREKADTTLQSNIDKLETNLTQQIKDEATAREAGEKELQTNIDNLNTTLTTKIENEATTRKAQDDVLQANLEAEATTRKAQDDIIEHEISDLSDKFNTTVSDLDSKYETFEKEVDTKIDSKVDKEEGKGLSSNDLTDELLAKLNSVQEGATNITKVSQLENDSDYQTADQVNALVEKIIGSAPEVLDTLEEIAKALGDDPDFAATITKQLTQLAQQINEEAETRASENSTVTSSIESLKEKLETEITDRKEAITALQEAMQNKLEAETEARKTADETLQKAIDAEATSRNSDIAAVKELAKSYYDTLNTLITNLQTSYLVAVENLTNQINSQSALITQNTANIQSNLALIQALQNQIKIIQETLSDLDLDNIEKLIKNFEDELDTIAELVSEEIEARTKADKELQANIDNLSIKHTEDITTLTNAINQEITDRKEAITDLSDTVNTELKAIETGITNLKSTIEDDIGSEATTRSEADTSLQSKITEEATARSEADTSLQNQLYGVATSIANEAETRAQADSVLQGNIDTLSDKHEEDMAAVKKNQDDFSDNLDIIRKCISPNTEYSQLLAKFESFGEGYTSLEDLVDTVKAFLTAFDPDDETINRWKEVEAFLKDITDTETLTGLLEQLKESLTTTINNETLRATKAEETLQESIGSEATARSEADTSLQSKITEEATRATNAETSLQTSLTAEVNRATNAETSLQTAITALQEASEKHVSSTVIKNIEIVDKLPDEPVSTTLYLIPIED